MEFLICILYLLFTLPTILTFLLISRKLNLFSGNLPPGPFPFPIIGNLLELGNKPHKSLTTLATTYGQIMTLKLGQKTIIVISSSSMAKQVLQTHDLIFSSRTIPDAIRATKHHHFSIVFLPVSTPWRNLRKICNSHVFTAQKLDAKQEVRREKVREALAEVEESIHSHSGISIGEVSFKVTLSLMSNTIFSLDFDDHGKFKEIVRGLLEEAGRPNLSDFFPFLQWMDPQGVRRRFCCYFRKIFDIFDQIIEQRLELRKEQNAGMDYDMLDTLLTISQENGEMINRTFIQHLLMDLFVAGTDTTSSTIEWAMAELLKNPETMSKAKTELRQIIGKGNALEESDIIRLPYLRAIVKETFRLHPSAPFLVPHKSESDIEISGFKIPKDAQILVNVWAIGRDPNKWENPNRFMPERFLGSEMDVRGRDFDLIPFGSGRRICPGLPLANRMVHLILGSLIHSFDWKLETGVSPENLNMDDKVGLTLQMAQELRAIPVFVS